MPYWKSGTRRKLNEEEADEPVVIVPDAGEKQMVKSMTEVAAAITAGTAGVPDVCQAAATVRGAHYYSRRRRFETPEAMIEAVEGYFRDCAERRVMPTYSGLAVSMGVTVRTLMNYAVIYGEAYQEAADWARTLAAHIYEAAGWSCPKFSQMCDMMLDRLSWRREEVGPAQGEDAGLRLPATVEDTRKLIVALTEHEKSLAAMIEQAQVLAPCFAGSPVEAGKGEAGEAGAP